MSSDDTDEFEVIDQLEASLSSDELAGVQAWLEPTAYEAQSSEFHRHISSQAPGTGLWISKTSKYQHWHDSCENGSLWIKGVPGAGKSVATASMIQHLRSTEGAPVLYFFFRHIISANRYPRSLIRDFLAQLVPCSVRLQATLQPLTSTPLDDFSDERLWEYLLMGLSSVEKAYCVIDALDEMELIHGDGFLDRLNKLASFRPDCVKLWMTSRPKQYLQSSLRDSSIVHISLEEDLVGKDISIFLSYRLTNLLPRIDQQELRDRLVDSISKRSDGLFLYARLLLDQISPNLSSDELNIEKIVCDFPVNLEEMYNSMLLQQAAALKIDVEVQVFLLELATHSSRALRLNEIASALASVFPAHMLPAAPKVIARSACAPLLEILEDETVSVIHHSFTEFLLNCDRVSIGLHHKDLQFPAINSATVHKRLSILCLKYLRAGGLGELNFSAKPSSNLDTFRGFRNYEDREPEGYREAKLQYPFLEYAVRNWAFHASKYDVEDDDFFSAIGDLLDPDSVEFKNWLKLEWMKSVESSDITAPTPLHILSFAGLTTYAKKLLQENKPVDARDAESRTPLHWACSRGHTSIVEILLRHGATPDPTDFQGVKPIHEAAKKNHAAIVKLLLEAGVDPLTPKTKENFKFFPLCGNVSTKGETAVEYAWLQGHTDTITTMVPFLTPETVDELFCQCCRYGKFEAVRALLQITNVSPSAKMDGATALFLACHALNVEIVQLLLEKGADVHEASTWEQRNRNCCGGRISRQPWGLPIHGLLRAWEPHANTLACQQILHLLIGAGTNINAQDESGDAPLLSLFTGSNSPDADITVVRALLKAGADCMVVDTNGDSPIHRCLRGSRNMKILKLLFEYGTPPNILGEDGNTLLHTASTCRYRVTDVSTETVVNYLLQIGVPSNMKNKHGITAVEMLASNRDCILETFTVLVRACADVDTLQRCLWQLTARKTKDTVAFIRVLQQFGVNLEDKNTDGKTVLLQSTCDDELFTALIECGADLKAVDYKGRGVLHHIIASHGASVKRLEKMAEMGLDHSQVDYEGNNLLHMLAKRYRASELDDLLVQKFLDWNISVNSRNNQGMTPLHIHLENYNPTIRQTAVHKRVDERFHERHHMLLLDRFQRNAPVDLNAQDSDGVTLFHLAAMRCEALMFYLLQLGADPAILTKHGRNALHLACRARQNNVVGYLCKNYPKMVNCQDEYGKTPLHDACTSGQRESVHLLLKAGADLTIVDNGSRNVLHSCAEFPNEQRIWDVLSNPMETCGQVFTDRFRPVFNNTRPSLTPWHTETPPPLSDAFVEKNDHDIGAIVKTLLSASSSSFPLAADSNRITPLDVAIQNNCQGMIAELKFVISELSEKRRLKSGDLKLPTIVALKTQPSSPLAQMDPDDPIRNEVFQNFSRYSPFLTFEDLTWILNNVGNLTGSDMIPILPSGQPLLHFAALKGYTSMMENFGVLACVNDDPKMLMEQIQTQLSVDPKYQSDLEDMAPTLHVACSRELPNMDMIETLVNKCGVNVNARALVEPERWANIAKSVEGGTALHILANTQYWWQLEAMEYLIQNGAEIDSLNEKGESPLHIACTGTTYAAMNCENDVYGYWRIEAVKILIQAGADVNIVDNDGRSCLHKASSCPQIMRILLDHAADPTTGSFSPVFSAIQIQCLETLTILIDDAGVSPNTVDPDCDNNDGFHLHYAAKDAVKSALFCASFSNLHNQLPADTAPLVRFLIERGADVYAALNESETLLHRVFESAEYGIVAAFIDSAPNVNIDFNTRDSLGRTVFIAACSWSECLPGYQHRHWHQKQRAPFLQILDLGADPLLLDNRGRNALHTLLDNSEMEEEVIIQFLADDAAKMMIHQRDQDGFTPLDCALRFLRPAVVEAMLSMGVSLLSADPAGVTALHRIAQQCFQVRPVSRRYREEYSKEYYAGALALWKKFLTIGGSVNVRDAKGAPPLFYFLSSAEQTRWDTPEGLCCHLENFATYFSPEIVKGLDYEVKNNDGENALHIIAKRENKTHGRGEHNREPTHNKQLYQFFVKKGLDPLAEDGNGRSSLDVAAVHNQEGILQLFQYRK